MEQSTVGVAAEPEKPTAGFIMSVISGVFILLGGLVQLSIALAASKILSFIGVNDAGLVAASSVGVVIGVVVIALGVVMRSRPRQHLAFGAAIIVLSFVSFYTSFFGGFLIGAVLGIVGGALGVAHKPGETASKRPEVRNV